MYVGPTVGLGFGYYMPYYGVTYYASYNPYGYYGQGDMCHDAASCAAMTTNKGISKGIWIGIGVVLFITIILCIACCVCKKNNQYDEVEMQEPG